MDTYTTEDGRCIYFRIHHLVLADYSVHVYEVVEGDTDKLLGKIPVRRLPNGRIVFSDADLEEVLKQNEGDIK